MNRSEISQRARVAILHYTAPPVVGGVEAVIKAHVQALVEAGYSVTVIAGRGEAEALRPKVEFIRVPKIDSQHPQIAGASSQLRESRMPSAFDELACELVQKLA
ncbi:MAG: hypothetical protein PVF04_05840, partial [Anaerolineae bacterium]